MCKVSVIIPYYNNEDTILRALESVICQTYKDFEIILIDDGSIDNSFFLVNSFMNKNKQFKIKNFQQENKGPSFARNIGINLSSGEYIAFLDADDEWIPIKLEKQIKIADMYNADLLGCNYNIIKENSCNPFFFIKVDFKRISFRSMLFKHYFATSCVIIKKEIILEVGGFPESQRYMEDSLMFTRIARKYSAYMIKDFIVNIYKSPYGESGLSENLFKMEKYELCNFKILKKENRDGEYKISSTLYLIINLFSVIKFLRRIMIIRIKNR